DVGRVTVSGGTIDQGNIGFCLEGPGIEAVAEQHGNAGRAASQRHQQVQNAVAVDVAGRNREPGGGEPIGSYREASAAVVQKNSHVGAPLVYHGNVSMLVIVKVAGD